MVSKLSMKSTIAVVVAAFALVAAVGCSSGTSASSDASDASASSEATVLSEASSSNAQSSEASSEEAQSSEAPSDEAQPSEASSEEAQASESAEPAPASESAEPASASEQAEPASESAEAMTAEDALAMGYQVLEGTVRVCTGEELIELQAIDIDPAAAGGTGTFAVLVFDEPIDVTGMSADGTGERTEPSNMLGIAEYSDYGSFVIEYGDLDACETLNGQRVTLAAQASDIMFPTDVSFPIGEPKAKSSIFLS